MRGLRWACGSGSIHTVLFSQSPLPRLGLFFFFFFPPGPLRHEAPRRWLTSAPLWSAGSGPGPLAGPGGGAGVREQPRRAACGDQAWGARDPPMQGRAWQDGAAAAGHRQGGAGVGRERRVGAPRNAEGELARGRGYPRSPACLRGSGHIVHQRETVDHSQEGAARGGAKAHLSPRQARPLHPLP